MKKNLLILFIALATSLTLAFENCSTPVSVSTTNSPTKTGGNGEPYEGKTYVLMGQCAGKTTAVVSRIILHQDLSASEIVTEKCRNISPELIDPAQLVFDPSSPATLTYAGNVYQSSVVMLEYLMQLVKGQPLLIKFTVTQGSLKAGETYEVLYDVASGGFTVTGVQTETGTVATYTTYLGDIFQNQIAMWGDIFDVDENYHIWINGIDEGYVP